MFEDVGGASERLSSEYLYIITLICIGLGGNWTVCASAKECLNCV